MACLLGSWCDGNPYLVYLFLALFGYWVSKFWRGSDKQDKKEEKPEEEPGEEEEKEKCEECKKEFVDDDLYECEECDNYYCDDCRVEFENLGTVCKNCIDEVYPREKEIAEKVYKQTKKTEKPSKPIFEDNSEFD